MQDYICWKSLCWWTAHKLTWDWGLWPKFWTKPLYTPRASEHSRYFFRAKVEKWSQLHPQVNMFLNWSRINKEKRERTEFWGGHTIVIARRDGKVQYDDPGAQILPSTLKCPVDDFKDCSINWLRVGRGRKQMTARRLIRNSGYELHVWGEVLTDANTSTSSSWWMNTDDCWCGLKSFDVTSSTTPTSSWLVRVLAVCLFTSANLAQEREHIKTKEIQLESWRTYK